MNVYINVRNFGKIKKARVNISNFTIFVGNNNSGKTQLMELIYSVVKKLSASTPRIEIPPIDEVDAFHIGKEEIVGLNKWVNNYLKNNINEIVEETFNVQIPVEEVTIEFEDIDVSYDIYFLKNRTIEYLIEKKMITQERALESIQNENKFYGAFIMEYDVDGKLIGESEGYSGFGTSIPVEFAKFIEVGCILGKILGGSAPVSSNVLFLPASRMGLMLLYKHYFGNNEMSQDDKIRDKYQNSKGITKPVLDFLSFLLKYSYKEKVAKKNEQILSFIFQHVIDGTISENGDLTTYIPKGEKKEIPIFVASSMVNEVVPVVKALTDSDEVNFVFYDEVETSLHPLKQIEMVKLLNRLNNKGIRLIVSTHSDTMATKINNLLLLSYANLDFDATKQLLENNGISIEKEDLLQSKNIHVYQFLNDEHGQSTVEELEFNKVPYTGFDFTLFNDSTMNLFEEAKIVMGIQDEN